MRGGDVRTYLGDSVYAELESGMIKLTTENGDGASNIIYLEPEVYRALQEWVKTITPEKEP